MLIRWHPHGYNKSLQNIVYLEYDEKVHCIYENQLTIDDCKNTLYNIITKQRNYNE